MTKRRINRKTNASQKENRPCKKQRVGSRKGQAKLIAVENYRKENYSKNGEKFHDNCVKKSERKKPQPKENITLREKTAAYNRNYRENNKEKLAKRARRRRLFGTKRRKFQQKNKEKIKEPKPKNSEKCKKTLTQKGRISRITRSFHKHGLKECAVCLEKLKLPIMAEEPKFVDESARVQYMLLEVEKMLDEWIPKKQE